MSHRALEHRDRAQGRKQTQRPGTRAGCMPDTGPTGWDNGLSLCLGPGAGVGGLPRVRAAVSSSSCNLGVQSPNLPGLPQRGSKLQGSEVGDRA